MCTKIILHHFTTLGSPTLPSFYPLWTNYPLILTPFYHSWRPNYYIILSPLKKLPPHSYTILPPWQPNSYINLPPLSKLPPHSYTILPTLAAQLLHHFTPSEQITPHSYIIWPIAAHYYKAISVSWGDNSWKVLRSQPIAAHTWLFLPRCLIRTHLQIIKTLYSPLIPKLYTTAVIIENYLQLFPESIRQIEIY